MQVRIKEDSVEISGYVWVNAVERDSKPLGSRIGQFIERICKGAFKKAINRNKDIHILLNHDWERDLGSTKKGNLKLEEDNIGLRACAKITDPEVIKKARCNELVGWSFGFQDRDVENIVQNGIPMRAVKDLDLFEVSILDRSKTPAYEGTLITARRDGEETILLRGEDLVEENVEVVIETTEEVKEEEVKEEVEEATEEVANEEQPEQQNVVEDTAIDYTEAEKIIEEIKEEV